MSHPSVQFALRCLCSVQIVFWCLRSGAFVGGVIGQNIGAQLDERDRLLAGEAYNTALEFNPTDKAAEWRNPDTGNYGRVIPVTTYRQNGRYCREFTQEIFVGGQKETGYGRACRQPDGSWEIVG